MVGAGVEDESSLDVPSSVALPGQGKVRICGGSTGERVRAPHGHLQKHRTSPSVRPTGLKWGLILFLP